MEFNYNSITYILKPEAEKVLDILVENRMSQNSSQGKVMESVSYEDVFDTFLSLYGDSLIKDIKA